MHSDPAANHGAPVTFPASAAKRPVQAGTGSCGYLRRVTNTLSLVLDPIAPGRILRAMPQGLTLLLNGLAVIGSAQARPLATEGGYRTRATRVKEDHFSPAYRHCLLDTGALPVPASRIIAHCAGKAASAQCDSDSQCLTTLQRSIHAPQEEIALRVPWAEVRNGFLDKVIQQAHANSAWDQAMSRIRSILDRPLWGNLPRDGRAFSATGLKSTINLMDRSERLLVGSALASISHTCGTLLRAEVAKIYAVEPDRMDTAGRDDLLEHLDTHFVSIAGKGMTPLQYNHIVHAVVRYLNRPG